jgi:hypothetical protein
VAQIDLDLVLLGKNIVTLQSDDLVWVPAAPLPSLSQVARETLDSARISMAKDRLREAGTASSPVDPPKVVAQAQESSENQ